MTGSGTGFLGVVARGGLHGLTFSCAGPLSILLDADPDAGGVGTCGHALRLLAGLAAPKSGKVTALGVDPMEDAEVRRATALLGDPALLGDEVDFVGALDAVAEHLAEIRGVSLGSVTKERRALGDALANDATARLVLVAYPEHYADSKPIVARARAALERGAKVVVATRTLETVLELAADDATQVALIARGTVVAATSAHALPWAMPYGATTRMVRIVVAARDGTALPPSAELASQLLADPAVAPHIASIEPISATELRVHARDPRAVVRAVAARTAAADGPDVRALSVVGAGPAELLGAIS